MRMPKKKIQHKGKPKHATEEIERPADDSEEEYRTVVDFEENNKFNKRLIESNWSKYEFVASSSDSDGEEGKDVPKTDDFNYLLKTASSDCSHFQFSSEKQWHSENNTVPSSKIFNLDLNILSSGLACVPFYKRMGLDESELSTEDKERFDKEASDSLKDYNLLREKLIKKSEPDSKAKNLEMNSKNLEEPFKVNKESQKNEKEFVNSGVGADTDKTIEADIFNDKDCSDDNLPKDKQKLFFNENENLEDWLDSVLDD